MTKKDYSLNYLKKQLELIAQAIQDSERAWNLYKAIGKKKDILCKTQMENYFGLSQRAFLFQAIISVGTIFEKPSKSYPTATLIEVISRLREEKQELKEIDIKKVSTITELTKNYPPQKTYFDTLLDVQFEKSKERKMGKVLADFLESLTPSEDDDFWNSLKFIRDKILAHKEIIEEEHESRLTNKHIEDMLKNAKLAVNTVGKAYFKGYHVPINNLKDYQSFEKLMKLIAKENAK